MCRRRYLRHDRQLLSWLVAAVGSGGGKARTVGRLAERHHASRKGAVLMGADALEARVNLVVVLDDVRLCASSVKRPAVDAVQI